MQKLLIFQDDFGGLHDDGLDKAAVSFQQIVNYMYLGAIILAVLSVAILGFRIVAAKASNDPNKAAQVLQGSVHIAIGLILAGSCATIASVINGFYGG